MNINVKRRIFLQRSLLAGFVAGLISPLELLAAWPEKAFKAKDKDTALTELLGSATTEASDAINIKAPDIAENGAVVPITVDSTIENAESITVIAAANPVPLVANFNLGKGALPYASTRIKMGKTGDVIAVVKAGGKLYSASKQVKVTIGGCGG